MQVFNWVQLGSDQSYANLLTGAPGALDHYWSLAIEEQFYWLWPIIVFVLARRNMLRGGIIALTVVAFFVAPLIAVVFGSDAAYWATPARAGEILAWCALAVVVDRRAAPSLASGTSAASIGLVVIVVCATTWPAASGPAYSGWLPVFAIASVAVILGVIVGTHQHPSQQSGAGRCRPSELRAVPLSLACLCGHFCRADRMGPVVTHGRSARSHGGDRRIVLRCAGAADSTRPSHRSCSSDRGGRHLRCVTARLVYDLGAACPVLGVAGRSGHR